MRRVIAIGVLILAGCANQYQQKFDAVEAARKADVQQVQAGTMKRSEMYTRFYNRLSEPPVSPNDYAAMQSASQMIDIAKQYESGAITKDQYDSAARESRTRYAGAVQQIDAEADAQRRAAIATYLQTRPRTTNCVGYANSASCTSY